jgi:hypothetical protein
MQHLPGRAASGQQGAISQALVRILGAAASHSSSAASSDALCTDQPALGAVSEQRAAAGNSPSATEKLTMQSVAAAVALSLSPGRSDGEHNAGGEGGAWTPENGKMASTAQQLQATAVDAQDLESRAAKACNAQSV